MGKNADNIDKIINEFNGKFEISHIDVNKELPKWLENFKTENIKEIALELFKNYEYLNREWMKNAFYNMYNKCVSENNIYIQRLVILPILKTYFSNGSIEYMGLLRELDRQYTFGFYEETIMSVINYEYINENIEYIMFFEDISGTGQTITTYIKKHIDIFKHKKLYLNICIVTNCALKEIESFLNDNKINYQINYEKIMEKAFDEKKILGIREKTNLKEIEKTLWGKKSKNILGYKDSQLLLSFFHNTPNNTISIFWFNEGFANKTYKQHYKKWNALFSRYSPNRIDKKKTMKNQNLTIAKIGKEKHEL